MTLGTKTLLFGGHQILVHPLLVLIAWIKLYKSLPNWKELLCIFIHDWGYWGMESLKCSKGDTHPEFGAEMAGKYLGQEWKDFILGHSTFYITRNKIKASKLLAPDKYWHCMIPLWLYKLLTIPTGEFAHYRGLKHARQVSALDATDKEWWSKLQKTCSDKAKGIYKVDREKLDRRK